MLRPHTTICREGWYYLMVVALVFITAMLKEVNLLLVLGGMLAGPLVFGWPMLRFSLRGLTVHRRLPQRICAGDLAVMKVSLTNSRRRVGSWAVVVEDRVERETAGPCATTARTSVLFPYVPAGGCREGVYQGRFPCRGRYRLGPLRLSSRFPFGLLCRTITVNSPEPLVVLPRLGRLTSGWFARQHQALAGNHRRQRRHGPDGDFYGVRQWQTGDSRRWIHWRTTARTGALVVRQFEQPQNRDAAVLVDLWQPKDPAPQERDHVELAVSFAATVVADLCRQGGSTLHLALAGVTPDCVASPATAGFLQNCLERLALAEPHDGDHLPQLLADVLRRLEQGTEIIVVSTRPLDLRNLDRFGGLWADPAHRAQMQRIRAVDTSSSELEQFFQPEA